MDFLLNFIASVTPDDLVAVGFLIFLEGILSIDNALVLAIIVRHLPDHLQRKALVYGIAGAVFFRIVAISLANQLMQLTWIKFVGGAYLLYLAADFFFIKKKEKEEEKTKTGVQRSFWMTVVVVELTDIAFAIDSILTAVALTKKLWVVVTGGVLGLIMMRFATSMFIVLLNRFPRFESTAYILVAIIGGKLFLDGFHFPGIDFHDSKNPWFWGFWLSMVGSVAYGFTKPKKDRETS